MTEPYCPRCHKSRSPELLLGVARCLVCRDAEIARDAAAAADFLAAGGRLLLGDVYTVTMHVFFLSLEETPTMLQRLRAADGSTVPKGPARSGIGGSLIANLTPIDRTAARVVPEGDAQ